MCVLCHDTFSRSDILKRHFIKCSVRRGNPTGASHLSHPQAHVKKNAAAQQKAIGIEDNTLADGMSTVANSRGQLSRSSRTNEIADDANRDTRSMTESIMGASTRPGSFDQTYNGSEVTQREPVVEYLATISLTRTTVPRTVV